MPRPFTDLISAISGEPIKNGTVVVSAQQTGQYKTSDTHVTNLPILNDIESKYGYRFYNGFWVSIAPSGNISNI